MGSAVASRQPQQAVQVQAQRARSASAAMLTGSCSSGDCTCAQCSMSTLTATAEGIPEPVSSQHQELVSVRPINLTNVRGRHNWVPAKADAARKLLVPEVHPAWQAACACALHLASEPPCNVLPCQGQAVTSPSALTRRAAGYQQSVTRTASWRSSMRVLVKHTCISLTHGWSSMPPRPGAQQLQALLHGMCADA